jgi:hypothetical protein
MKKKVLRRIQISILISFLFAPMSYSSVVQLTSPNVFSNSSTLLNFDDGVDLQIANTLYLGQGVVFSRDDGQGVAISNWVNSGRNTTSSPNVLTTIGAPIPGYPATTWTTHLNANFAVPVYEVGAYFGNDQLVYGILESITLSAYGDNHIFLGLVTVKANRNTSVDQFIGLSSNEPIYSVRFQNNGSTNYAVTIDNFLFTQIPEPASLLLLGLGGLLLRRKK